MPVARKTHGLINKCFGLCRAAPLWSDTMTIVKEGCFSMFLYPFLRIFFCYLISCISGQKTKGQSWCRGSKLPTTRNVCPKECFEAPPADTGRFSSLPNSLGSLPRVHESTCKLHEKWETNYCTKLEKKSPPFQFTKLFPSHTLFVRICASREAHLELLACLSTET